MAGAPSCAGHATNMPAEIRFLGWMHWLHVRAAYMVGRPCPIGCRVVLPYDVSLMMVRKRHGKQKTIEHNKNKHAQRSSAIKSHSSSFLHFQLIRIRFYYSLLILFFWSLYFFILICTYLHLFALISCLLLVLVFKLTPPNKFSISQLIDPIAR